MSADPMAVLADARRLLDSGDPERALAAVEDMTRSGDPELAGAAWMLIGTGRYRMDDEPGAMQAWRAAADTESAASWIGWRSMAEQQVRDGDLNAAIEAYREADHRAPPMERPAIASRLAWLAKETGHDFTARREFNRSRAAYATYAPFVTWVLIGANVGVFAIGGLLAMAAGATMNDVLFGFAGGPLQEWGSVRADAIAAGEWWRILTGAFLHVNAIHILFNMWALYLFGPLLEQLYGRFEYLVIYVLCAAGGSVLTILATPDQPVVGASGAIFGLLGLAFAVSRRRHLALPRQTRMVLGQVGSLILINLVITFAFAGRISVTGHLGGLAVGLVLGWLLPPSPAFTLAGQWQVAGGAVIAGMPMLMRVAVYLGVAGLLVAGTAVAMLNIA